MIVTLALFLYAAFTSTSEDPADSSAAFSPFFPYREDDFFGVTWRWRYGAAGIMDLVCFCPVCDYQIRPVSTGYFPLHTTRFECEECQRLLGEESADFDEIKSRVIRKNQRKMRAMPASAQGSKPA